MLKPSLICVQHAFEMAEFVCISKAKYSHQSCLWHLLIKIPLRQGPVCVWSRCHPTRYWLPSPPRDYEIKPEVPEQLEFYPGPGQGQDLTGTDWTGPAYLSFPLIL